MVKDKTFLAEGDKMKLIDPVTGGELSRMIAGLFTLDPELLAKLKAILYR